MYVYGVRSKGEFPKLYQDFIRTHGAPSALRRDNAREEKSEEVIEVNRELLVKDEFTEPHHPQQNPVESGAIRYLKEQVQIVLDQTGAPDSAWFFAAKYVADIHNICSDSRLPNGITPHQMLKGDVPDISALLQFTFWQPILFLDHESLWPRTKEQSGFWLGVADNIGDSLTFWVFDSQSKQVLARSVVRPIAHNHRVKWDPILLQEEQRNTAHHGGDMFPDRETQNKLLSTAFDKYDKMEDEPTPVLFEKNQLFETAKVPEPLRKEKIENPPMDPTT
jgi:hypothetical protein